MEVGEECGGEGKGQTREIRVIAVGHRRSVYEELARGPIAGR